MHRWLSIVSAALISSTLFAGQHEDVTTNALKPNQTVQEALKTLQAPIKSPQQAQRNLEMLRRLPRDELIRQLLLFAVEADTMGEAMTPAYFVEQFDISHREIADAVAKYLDSPDERVRKQVENWLGGGDRNGPPNFAPYLQLLRGRTRPDEPPPLDLIGRMYRVDPQAALFAMMSFYEVEPRQAKPLRWSDHLVKEVLWRKQWEFEVDPRTLDAAKTELEQMLQNDKWWVRLYVAEIIRRHPELGNEALLKRLKKDKDELVKRVVSDMPGQ